MIYFTHFPVARVEEDSITLANGTVLSGFAALEQLTDDCGGEELFAARLELIRRRRDRLLAQCDWTQLVDTDLTETAVRHWRAYRQELRDMTAELDPQTVNHVEWPVPPPADMK